MIASGGEPYAQPFMKLNALEKTPDPRHDWTVERLRAVQRWVNRRLWRACPRFEDYNPSAKTRRVDRRQLPLFAAPVLGEPTQAPATEPSAARRAGG